MTLNEMRQAQAKEMIAELQSLVERNYHGDDGYDDLTNGLEFLNGLVVMHYELPEELHEEALNQLFNPDPYAEFPGTFIPAVRPTHMQGLDSLAPSILEEFYRRHPEEKI